MSLNIVLVVAGVVLFLEVIRSHWNITRFLKIGPKPEKLSSYPSTTVIRPVKGIDYGLEKNLEAALDHGYPGHVQTIFVFNHENEPAYATFKKRVDAYQRETDAKDVMVIISGDPPPHRTGKLNAMITAFKEAKGEIIVFADSDIRPDRDTLRILTEALMSDPKIGSTFANVVVTEAPKTFGDVGYALLLNGCYSPFARMTSRRDKGVFSFIMGQIMMMKREAIRAAGGLECMEGQLVDDMHLGHKMTEAGYKNVMVNHIVPIIHRERKLWSFILLYNLWITFSRTGIAMSDECKWYSMLRWIVFWGGVGVAIVALVLGYPLAALAGALAPMATGWSIHRLHKLLGGGKIPLRYFWAGVAIMLMGPLVYLSTYVKHEVIWRGYRYKLDRHARLALN